MKKNIFLIVLLGFVFTTQAQLLVSDSAFTSYDGVSFNLSSVDSSYHDAGNCRLAYDYTKVFSIVTQQLTNSVYKTYDYLGDGNLRQVVIQTWNPGTGTYVNSSRSTFTYYLATSKPLSTLTEIWANNTAWRNSSLQTNTYDANGFLTTSIQQTWNTTSAAWVKAYETDYYNKNNGLADSAINKDYINNVVTHQTKDIYTYNATGTSPFRVVNQTRVNNQWQDSTRSTFTYTANGKPASIAIDIYSTVTQTWDPLSTQSYIYNAAGDLIRLTQNISYLGFSIINQIRYNPLPCTTSTVTPGELCPAGNTTLSAGVTGVSYQWQVNSGSGFTNIANNGNYAGATTTTLTLSNIPSAWYGYQYRCVAGGQNGTLYTIKFVNKWTGAANSQWENGANWSCGAVPDANTDVIISSGIVVLNSNRSVRSLTVNPAARFTANSGFNLTIMH